MMTRNELKETAQGRFDTIQANVARLVRKKLEATGLSYQQLGDQIGMQKNMVWRVIHPDGGGCGAGNGVTGIAQLAALVDWLGVPLAALGEEWPEPGEGPERDPVYAVYLAIWSLPVSETFRELAWASFLAMYRTELGEMKWTSVR